MPSLERVEMRTLEGNGKGRVVGGWSVRLAGMARKGLTSILNEVRDLVGCEKRYRDCHSEEPAGDEESAWVEN